MFYKDLSNEKNEFLIINILQKGFLEGKMNDGYFEKCLEVLENKEKILQELKAKIFMA
jgi:hypothetical protein